MKLRREIELGSLPPPFSVPEDPPLDPVKLLDWLKKKDVDAIMPAIVGADGHPRGPWVGIGELLNICAVKPSVSNGPGGMSTDGSSISGGYGVIESSDTRMIIDPASVRRLPGYDGLAIGFGDAMTANPRNPIKPTPNPGCFRSRLKKALDYMLNNYGVKFRGGLETEFYFYPKGTELTAPYVSGIPDRGNYQQAPDRNPDHDALIAMLRFLAQDGLRVTVAHTEVGFRQVEINTAAADLVRASEDFMVLRIGLLRIADLLGYVVDLSAKPVEQWTGSGEHTHLSAQLAEGDGTKNALFNANGTLTEFGGYFIGGISECVGALTYLGNLFESCYRRLSVPGCEAPNCHGFGWGNRTVSRFTGPGHDSFHLEFRAPSPDGTHAYALYTGLLAAGVYGLENKIRPPKLVTFNAYKYPGKLPKLPRNLDQAKDAFSRCEAMKWAFTPQQFNALVNR